jgi:hypothetical protein
MLLLRILSAPQDEKQLNRSVQKYKSKEMSNLLLIQEIIFCLKLNQRLAIFFTIKSEIYYRMPMD